MLEEEIYSIRFWLGNEMIRETRPHTLKNIDKLLTGYENEETVISEALERIYPAGCDRNKATFEIVKYLNTTETQEIRPIFYNEDINVLDDHNKEFEQYVDDKVFIMKFLLDLANYYDIDKLSLIEADICLIMECITTSDENYSEALKKLLNKINGYMLERIKYMTLKEHKQEFGTPSMKHTEEDNIPSQVSDDVWATEDLDSLNRRGASLEKITNSSSNQAGCCNKFLLKAFPECNANS